MLHKQIIPELDSPARAKVLCTCGRQDAAWHGFHDRGCEYYRQMINEWYFVESQTRKEKEN